MQNQLHLGHYFQGLGEIVNLHARIARSKLHQMSLHEIFIRGLDLFLSKIV